MQDERNQNVNLAEALAEGLHEHIEEVRDADSDAEYTQGQLDFYEDVIDTVDGTGGSPRVDDLLEDVAAGYGLAFSDGGIDPLPDSPYMLGVCTAWGVAWGFSQGIAKGAMVAMDIVNQLPGVEGSIDVD